MEYFTYLTQNESVWASSWYTSPVDPDMPSMRGMI